MIRTSDKMSHQYISFKKYPNLSMNLQFFSFFTLLINMVASNIDREWPIKTKIGATGKYTDTNERLNIIEC